ncbi:hypothetical protein ACIQ1D_17695 [Lysinibacillus xylanilyticus]|uniref:hypothetical protein n=1 Tax=Lysinibacillus xylanilyticus TaxID=582475 RepID=UPI003814FAC6
MRSKKWMVLIFYTYLFLSVGYLTYSAYSRGDDFWIVWGILSIGLGYQVVRFLIDKKKDGWNTSYVVADHRILGKIKLSMAISYVFIIVFLITGAYGIQQGFFIFEAFDTIVAAIIFSLLVFMISQVVQQFIN